MRAWGAILPALLLAACGGGAELPPAWNAAPPPAGPQYRPPAATYNPPAARPVPATPLAPIAVAAVSPTATSAVLAGLVPAPAPGSLPVDPGQAARALAAFRASCPSLMRRTDASGLTRGADWGEACNAARVAGDRDATDFFARYFETVQVGDGRSTATGYYIPEIAGSRERRPGYEVPIFGRPSDLTEIDLGAFSSEYAGKKIRGRIEGRNFVPYFDRAQIDAGALQGRAPIIAWAADPVELFFLQIQGSGLLRLPDGGIMRIGYDSQNGREYVGIGALMLQRGLVPPGGASMQGIMGWIRANPEAGRRLMEENKSYVFFRVMDSAAVGSLGIPVAAGASAATDPRFIPLGAPVFLSMDRADANGIWIAQDTGGAIKGPNRIDTFWGAGENARATAGGMKARGTAWVLVPRGTLARLAAEGRLGGAPLNP